MILNWEALKAIIKQYVLYDHQCRRSILGFVAVLGPAMLVLTLLFIFGKLPALFLFTISTAVSFAASFAMPIVLAVVIQREKAEGSFRALRALPLKAGTLFGGTVLAGVIASILALLPLYMIATIGLILRGGDVALLQIYIGVVALLMSFLSTSFTLTLALCVNSPTALSYLIAGFLALGMLPGILMPLFKQKIRSLLESRLEKLFYFVLSLEGQIFVSAIVIILSALILYTGSRIFSRKKAYV